MQRRKSLNYLVIYVDYVLVIHGELIFFRLARCTTHAETACGVAHDLAVIVWFA
jgi:hypothetical protein